MRYGEVIDLLAQEGFEVKHYTHANPMVVHRLMGTTYVGVKHREPGSGHYIEYDEEDVRRAVAGLRLNRLLGEGKLDRMGSHERNRIIERVSHERHGWVLWAANLIGWFDDPVELAEALSRSLTAFIVVPCYVRSLEQLYTSP